MFLRCSKRLKDGKEHHYWSIVENKRVGEEKVVQRHVLYLGEINDSQRESWRKTTLGLRGWRAPSADRGALSAGADRAFVRREHRAHSARWAGAAPAAAMGRLLAGLRA